MTIVTSRLVTTSKNLLLLRRSIVSSLSSSSASVSSSMVLFSSVSSSSSSSSYDQQRHYTNPMKMISDTSAKQQQQQQQQYDIISSDNRDEFVYSISFADTNSNSNNPTNLSLLYQITPQQQRQIHYATNQLIVDPPIEHQQQQELEQQQQLHYESQQNVNHPNPAMYQYDMLPLPTTLEDAIRPCKNRAIIITETTKPYRVVDVNRCWMELCGYTYVESVGKTIGSLLHGPKTNPQAATTLIYHLLHGENDVGTILVNYKKDGTPFVNRIRVGPIYNPAGSTTVPTHFVGVLQQLAVLEN